MTNNGVLALPYYLATNERFFSYKQCDQAARFFQNLTTYKLQQRKLHKYHRKIAPVGINILQNIEKSTFDSKVNKKEPNTRSLWKYIYIE